jgi:O-antigen ligase
MISAIYLLVILGLAPLALTKRRIFVLCGFYCIYGFLKVLGQGEVVDWSTLAVFRALYLILPISMVARFIQDRDFMFRVRRWPLVPYFLLLAMLLAASLHSPSIRPFGPDNSADLWSHLVICSLFWLAASQVQQEDDLKIFAGATVLVSLALSTWVIWNTARLNFEAYRGGIDVNQNYVSEFVLAGALPLIYFLFTGNRRFLKFACLPILLYILLGGSILASRGLLVAFGVGTIFMGARLIRSLRPRTMLALGAALVLVFSVAMFLPGSESLLGRFQEGDLGTLNDRTFIWSHSLRYFGDSGLIRMIFGQGLSSGVFVISPVLPEYENYHNEYLMWLLDLGVVGLIAFLAFLYSVARRALSCSHPHKDLMMGWLAFLFVTGLSSTISDLHLFWILLGVIVAASSLAGKARSSPQPAMAWLSQTSPPTSSVPRPAEGI